MLPHYLLDSEEFGRLTPHAVKALLDLARQYRGDNNGDLSAAWSVMSKRGWRSKSTLWAALRELVNTEFTRVSRQGNRYHVCTLYAVTWLPVNDCNGKHVLPVETKPSNAWRKTEKQVAIRTHAFGMRTLGDENGQKAA
jgi:hypothetical protein